MEPDVFDTVVTIVLTFDPFQKLFSAYLILTNS
jgi:hypothetical protein